MRILFPCFPDLYKPQKSLEGIRLVRRPYPKSDLKFKENHLEKKSQLFSKMKPNGSPLGPEILPKSIKSQTKALEALITKSSEKLLEKVSLQTPPGPHKIKQNHGRVCQKSKVALSGFSWFKVSFLTSFCLHFLGAGA